MIKEMSPLDNNQELQIHIAHIDYIYSDTGGGGGTYNRRLEVNTA